MERESKVLEYKESVSKSFLKTVSAFANYGTGKIIFGISDSLEVISVSDPIQTCLDVENMINDNIKPIPDFSIEINSDDTITLIVKEGLDKPYLYNNKAYRRGDSATVEVDRVAFTRLILEGSNRSFEEMIAKEQNLTFEYLKRVLVEKLGIKEFNSDTLKTLQLMNHDGTYNIAGELLADQNAFKGIDIVRFGDSINEIENRVTLENMSILEQFHKTMDVFSLYYEVEVIDGFERKKVELIPRKAFREVIANALVHRLWDIEASIRIGMYKDKITVYSPEGLPNDVSEEDYLNGVLSILRNPIIGNVFFRLNYIEKFGTGIKRINAAYQDSSLKPVFDLSTNVISTTLPVINSTKKLNVNESIVFNCLSGGKILSRLQLEQLSDLSKTQVIRALNSLIEKELVVSTGTARNQKYRLK